MRFFDWGPPLADGETNRFDTRPPAEWPQGPKALALADALAHDCVNHWDIVRAYEALETVFPDYPPAAIDKILRVASNSVVYGLVLMGVLYECEAATA